MFAVRELSSTIIDQYSQRPYLIVVSFVAIVFIYTFFSSLIKFRSAAAKLEYGPAPAPTLPYRIPWVGHAVSFVTGLHSFLASRAHTHATLGAFALHLGGTRHNVVIAPSVTHHILTARNVPVHMHELVLRTVETFWGDREKAVRATGPKFLWEDAHRILSNMMRESFVTSALAATVSSVQSSILNLVSGNDSPVDQSSWERTAMVSVTAGSSTNPIAEADLFILLRDFVGTIATSVLMGSDFMVNYPSALQDLWIADSQFNLFMSGLPDWIPALRQPSQARNRLVEAVRQHHLAYQKYAAGEDPGALWGNIEDTSTVIQDRALAWQHAAEQSQGKDDGTVGGIGDSAVVWAMNINANQVIFWMIFYIFSDPVLLAEIREEVAPYVQVSQPEKDLPVQPQPSIKIDLDGLRKKCPILQGAFLETMRLEAASLSYKYVEEDFSVTESPEDAHIFKHAHPWTYQFRAGEYICIPHGVHQSDERYFTNPQAFDPKRFWEGNEDTHPEEKSTAEDGNILDAADERDANGTTTRWSATESPAPKISYRTMKVWGGGKEVCKGKKFAEGEVVLFVAAIVHFWDIKPVDDIWGREGKWTHPGRKESAGSAKPKRNVRVRMCRRES